MRDAFAVRERRGDPRAVPGFRCSFAPGMPSSTTPGSPIIDSSRTAMSTWPSPRIDRLGTPKAPAIRFTRAMTFVASWFTHLLRPARLLAPRYGSDHLRGQRGLLLPGFQRDRPVAGYHYCSDWTPLLTGLSRARMTNGLDAPLPSSYWTCTTYSLPVSRRTCVKTPDRVTRVDESRRNCTSWSRIALRRDRSKPRCRIVFSTLFQCMSFHTARVIFDRVS